MTHPGAGAVPVEVGQRSTSDGMLDKVPTLHASRKNINDGSAERKDDAARTPDGKECSDVIIP